MIAIKPTKGKIGSEPLEFVVHPMFDVPEEKLTGDGLGQMAMSPTVRWCLFALRSYVVLMLGLLAYHVLDLAGVFGHHLVR